MFFVNFTGRVILGPLMPAVEADLGIGHAAAGSLFLLISLGYCVGLLVSGAVSQRLTHRGTIALSSVVVGTSLLAMASGNAGWVLRFGLAVLGFGSGIYLPSGVATITSLVAPRDWGKALALHELAPNSAFALAPLLAEGLLARLSWRGALGSTGAATVALGLIFWLFGRGGASRGEVVNRKEFRKLARNPTFWIIALLFGAGIGMTFGVYTMLPLYLTSGLGLPRARANETLAVARLFTLGAIFCSGWLTDRLGARRSLVLILAVGGAATVLLGFATPGSIAPLVIFQSVIAAWFFPPAFAALSSIGPLALTFAIPISTVLGSGLVPTAIGALGQRGEFGLGMGLMGGIGLACALLASRMRGGRGLKREGSHRPGQVDGDAGAGEGVAAEVPPGGKKG